MRVIGEVPHNHYKITLFNWNGKFIIKIESGWLEQSYKVDEFDIMENELHSLLDETFLASVADRFRAMHADFQATLERH